MRRLTNSARSSKPLAFMLAAAVAAGCASSGTMSTSSGGDVAPNGARVVDTTGRVTPSTGGISPTAAPPALGPGVTGAPQPGTPAVATQDATTGATAAAAGMAGMNMDAGGPSMGARSDANIVALLHASNVGEIQAGTLAQQRASNAAVRSFAQQMVSDHSALDAHGTAVAAQAGITPALPDSMLPRQHMADQASLQSANGAAFDRAYISQQVVAHQKTLALVDAAIPMASNAQLRTMLQGDVRPRVADHLRMAQQLQGQVGTAP